jgi:hypothetical protein
MATLAARTDGLEAELKEARRIAAKKKPKKTRNPRRKYDKEGPPSTTLQDWVLTVPNDELFCFLVRIGHPGWFLQRLSADEAREYVLERRWKTDTDGSIIPLDWEEE